MRIGFIVRRDVPNINYRAVGPANVLRDAGHQIEMLFVDEERRLDTRRLRTCDVVHTYRLTGDPIRACMDDLQRHGVALTWDNDDDIRLLGEESRRRVKISAMEAERDFRDQGKVFKRVDLVTTTSETLAERFGAMGAPRVTVIPNHLHPDQYTDAPRHHDGLVIGWVAGLEHEVDARALGISETLAAILERHRDVRVVSIGVRLDLDSDRYEHHSVVQLPELKDHIRQFDVALAPISDIAMNHARSDVKVKEYAAAGVPWLASARGPYAGLGPSEGGMLVEDDGWEAALEALVSSRMKRWRLARKATAWGRSQSLDRQIQRWVDAFEDAVAAAQERPSATRAGARAARA